MREIIIKRNDVEHKLKVPFYVADVWAIIRDNLKTEEQKLLDIFKILNGEEIHVSTSLLKKIKEIEVYQYLESTRQDILDRGGEVSMMSLYEGTARHCQVSITTVRRVVERFCQKKDCSICR